MTPALALMPPHTCSAVEDQVLVKNKKGDDAAKAKRKAEAAREAAQVQMSRAERRKLDQIARKKASQARLKRALLLLDAATHCLCARLQAGPTLHPA